MTSVANVPAYMLPGVPAVQQPRSGLDSGDPTLATEILPGPPSLASVQQTATKRDPRKPMPVVSYLPQYDPGTTYGGVTTGPTVGSLEQNLAVEGPRRKRARIDKGYVVIFSLTKLSLKTFVLNFFHFLPWGTLVGSLETLLCVHVTRRPVLKAGFRPIGGNGSRHAGSMHSILQRTASSSTRRWHRLC